MKKGNAVKKYATDQEKFWAGKFGDEYIDRNTGQRLLASNISLFSRILEKTDAVRSVIEFGANLGSNLMALRMLLPEVDLSAIEINQKAVQQLKAIGDIKVYPQSILDFKVDRKRNLVLIKGVLIHINPNKLEKVYDLMYRASNRYICVAEYYNPTPVAINYRGHTDRLFKRDFAGELLEIFKDLRLLDYGFAYHRDNNFPHDDITWFLLEKRS